MLRSEEFNASANTEDEFNFVAQHYGLATISMRQAPHSASNKRSEVSSGVLLAGHDRRSCQG
jgi:hypothetical protein